MNDASKCILILSLVLAVFMTGCPGGETECDGPGCDPPAPQPDDDACRDNSNCEIGLACIDGTCQTPMGCTSDSQCPNGEQCIEGGCYVIDPPDIGRPDVMDPDPNPDPNPQPDVGMDADQGCEGCVQDTEQGELCLPGTFDNACGGGGALCMDCGQGRSCDEGVCVDTITCGPDNCDGCCNGEACESGSTDFACGFGGLQCQRCTNGASCEQGECIVPCGPDNCTGCCDEDGECDPFGDFDSSCGLGGERCQDCGNGQRCDTGECIDLTCSETCDGCCSGDTCLGGNSSQDCGFGGRSCVDCGPGRLCEDSECVLDPRSRWDVLVLGADLSATDAGGSAWDTFGGLPDPFIRLIATDFVDEVEGESEIDDDTTTPFWAENVITDVSADALMTSLTLRIFDSDVFGEQLMSSCRTTVGEDLFTGNTLSITCPSGDDVTEATIRFQIHRH